MFAKKTLTVPLSGEIKTYELSDSIKTLQVKKSILTAEKNKLEGELADIVKRNAAKNASDIPQADLDAELELTNKIIAIEKDISQYDYELFSASEKPNEAKPESAKSYSSPKLKPLKLVGGLDFNFTDKSFVPIANLNYGKSIESESNLFVWAFSIKFTPVTTENGTADIVDYYLLNGGSVEGVFNLSDELKISDDVAFQGKLAANASYLNYLDSSVANNSRAGDFYLRFDASLNAWLIFAYVGAQLSYTSPTRDSDVLPIGIWSYKVQALFSIDDKSYFRILYSPGKDNDTNDFQVGFTSTIPLF